jgi:hypothetical protein
MAVHFINGDSHKNNAPVPPALMKKAVTAAKTYDWTDDPTEVAEIEGAEPPEKEDTREFPRKYACRKTRITATRMTEASPVFFVKGELLLLTADEQTVRDIIT